MISFLHGMVREVSDQYIVLDVGGVGFTVFVAHGQNYIVQEKIELFIYLHWIEDQGPILYGFSSEQDKMAFMHIISCPSIGPKLGIAVIRHLGASNFFSAVLSGNAKALSSVSGLGTKKAETILLHLKDKIAQLVSQGQIAGVSESANHIMEVSQALQALQYTRMEISPVIASLQKLENIQNLTFDELMRKALGVVSKKMKS